MPPLPVSVGSRSLVLALVAVERIVEAGDHARGVAEGGMRRDVFDPLAIDVDGAAVAQRVEIFLAGLRATDFDVAGVLGRRAKATRSSLPPAFALRLACHRVSLPLPSASLMFDNRTVCPYSELGITIRLRLAVGKGSTGVGQSMVEETCVAARRLSSGEIGRASRCVSSALHGSTG